VRDKARWIDEARERVPKVATALAPYFAANGWTWLDTGVPTAAQIEAQLYELLDNVARGAISSATGRLCVEAMQDGEYCVGVRMFAEIEP
jgi:hypothetical protein